MSKALAVNATVSGRQRFFDFLYKWGMLLTVVLLVAVFGLASDNFLDPFNIINILRSIAIVTVIAIGVSISLTIGGFDLSVGSTASLANALVISLFVWHGLGTTEAILITLALCTLVGLFNAFLIVVLRIPDMLATPGQPVCDSGRGNDIQLWWVDYRKHGAAERRDGGGVLSRRPLARWGRCRPSSLSCWW